MEVDVEDEVPQLIVNDAVQSAANTDAVAGVDAQLSSGFDDLSLVKVPITIVTGKFCKPQVL